MMKASFFDMWRIFLASVSGHRQVFPAIFPVQHCFFGATLYEYEIYHIRGDPHR